MSFPVMARQYTVPVEEFYHKNVFEIGTRILYRYFDMKGRSQADITVKNANGTWENICYLYNIEKGEQTPHFDLCGPVWDQFRYGVKFELLNKVQIVN